MVYGAEFRVVEYVDKEILNTILLLILRLWRLYVHNSTGAESNAGTLFLKPACLL